MFVNKNEMNNYNYLYIFKNLNCLNKFIFKYVYFLMLFFNFLINYFNLYFFIIFF